MQKAEPAIRNRFVVPLRLHLRVPQLPMTRPWIVVLLGLLLGAAGFGFCYGRYTAADRQLEARYGPELAWIKKEFRLSDEVFERVRTLHEAYKPLCAERCRQIDAQNQHLTHLLQTAGGVTPQIEECLQRAAQLRTQCQTEMLRHFFQVSQAMPEEQGRRYLAWMQSQTLSPTHASMLPRIGAASGHDHSAHR